MLSTKVKELIESYDAMMRCGIINQVSGNEFQFQKYENFKLKIEELRDFAVNGGINQLWQNQSNSKSRISV